MRSNHGPPETRTAAPAGTRDGGAKLEALARASEGNSYTEALASSTVLLVLRDRSNGQYRLVRGFSGGEGAFAPVASFLDAGAAVRAGLREVERTGARFLGVAR